MEVFQNDMIIRLKNGQDRYLVADKDQESISKCRDGSTKNAQWTVELYDKESIYLKSCYNKYLTASNKPSIPGFIAKNLRVTQTLPEKKNTSHLWLPVNQSNPGEQPSMWLRTLHGSHLRAHHGPPPFGNLITHDLLQKDGPDPLDKKILWYIEIVESPSDLWKQHSESTMSKMMFGGKSLVSEKHKDKEKSKSSKVEKEARKGCIPIYILSRRKTY